MFSSRRLFLSQILVLVLLLCFLLGMFYLVMPYIWTPERGSSRLGSTSRFGSGSGFVSRDSMSGALPGWLSADASFSTEEPLFLRKPHFPETEMFDLSLYKYEALDVLFKINRGGNISVSGQGASHPRVQAYLDVLHTCGDLSDLEDRVFVIDVGDVAHDRFVMNFCRNKHHRQVIPIPSFDFVDFWHRQFQHVDYEHKISKAFWRGSTTGSLHGHHIQGFSDKYSSMFPRTLLMEHCNDPRYCDVGFHQLLNSQEETHLQKYVKSSIPLEEHVLYKLLVNADGNSCALRLKYLLNMDSVVLKHDSPFEEFFYHDLKAHVDYVPVAYDFADILPVVQETLAARSFYIESLTLNRVRRLLSKENVCAYFKAAIKHFDDHVHPDSKHFFLSS